ncbi:MAG: GNAT family N-acetyltransferase [Pleurocapsa sp.]
MNISLPEGYQLKLGSQSHRHLLINYLKLTYQELYPQQDNFEHLTATVNRYFSERTPLWLIERKNQSKTQSTVGCLWLGKAVNQKNGETYAHILLIYVSPQDRRCGLGTALIKIAEHYARSSGDRAIGLQVFTNNQAAMNLYQNMGFAINSVAMLKPLQS